MLACPVLASTLPPPLTHFRAGVRSRVRARACASRKVTARNYAGRPGVAHDDSAFAAAAATATTLHSFVSPMSVSAFFATSLPAACGLEETSSSPKAELLARCCAALRRPPLPPPVKVLDWW